MTEKGNKISFARYDQGEIRGNSIFTEEGFLKCDAIVTRTGVFNYKNPDGTIRRELRHPDDVLRDDSLQTMKLIPLTNGHPEERLVDSENAKRLSVGYTGEKITPDGSWIFTNFVVSDAEAIKDITQFGKNQLSLGYTVDLLDEQGEYEGKPYDFRQSNIRYNHLSLVSSARAGSEARIALDENDAEEISQTEESTMAKRKVKMDQEEFLMEPEMADSVEGLLENMKNLEAEKSRVEEELNLTKEKLETALAERDSAKEEAEKLLNNGNGNGEEGNKGEKMDSKEINRLVQERVKLIKMSETCLDSADLEKIHKMDDLEIKKKIIKAKHPNANLDDKTEIYINARLDALIEDSPKSKVIVRGQKTTAKTDDNVPSADDARNRMIDNLKNGYKLGGK